MGRLSVRRAVVLVAAVMVAALTARLGVWQLDRAGQKERLQAAIDAHRCPPEPPNCPGCGRRMVCRRNDDDGATFECQCGGRFTTLNRGQLHLGVIDPR